MSEFKRQIEYLEELDDNCRIFVIPSEFARRLVDAARKEILENSTVLSEDLIMVDKKKFEKWFGDKK